MHKCHALKFIFIGICTGNPWSFKQNINYYYNTTFNTYVPHEISVCHETVSGGFYITKSDHAYAISIQNVLWFWVRFEKCSLREIYKGIMALIRLELNSLYFSLRFGIYRTLKSL